MADEQVKIKQQRSNVTIPKYLREQVDELIGKGAVTTLNAAVNSGLSYLVHQHKLQRWDDLAYSEYQANLLSVDRAGVLTSTTFKKDVLILAKDLPQIRRHL